MYLFYFHQFIFRYGVSTIVKNIRVSWFGTDRSQLFERLMWDQTGQWKTAINTEVLIFPRWNLLPTEKLRVTWDIKSMSECNSSCDRWNDWHLSAVNLKQACKIECVCKDTLLQQNTTQRPLHGKALHSLSQLGLSRPLLITNKQFMGCVAMSPAQPVILTLQHCLWWLADFVTFRERPH